MLHFSCPHCQKRISCNESMAGRRAKCPGCGNVLTVPSAGEFKWYFVVGGKRFGPVDKSVLIRLALQKKIKPTDKVWSRSLGKEWVEARLVEGLFEASPAPEAKKPVQPSFVPVAGGNTPNAELMRKARESLVNNRSVAAVVMIFTMVISAVPIVGLFLAGPLTVGMSHYYLKLMRRQKAVVQDLFDKTNLFLPSLLALLCIGLIIMVAVVVPLLLGAYFMRAGTLGLAQLCMLFAVVIVSYFQVLYSMTFFILADGQAQGPVDAVRLSAKWMKGCFWKYVGLYFRFFGWMLLTALTFGIAIFWVGPYMLASQACFYEDLKKQA